MDTAAALAQLKECMNAPAMEVPVVVLYANGKTEELVIDHRKVNEILGGTPTVVGGIRRLDVMAFALRDGGKRSINSHALPECFDEKIRGHIVLLRTDDSAAPTPFTAKEWTQWVKEGMQDDEQESDEGEDMEEEEEEGEEEDDDEE